MSKTDVSHNDRFEALGDLYYRATGYLRPGKSEPLETGRSANSDENRERFEQWLATHGWAAERSIILSAHESRGLIEGTVTVLRRPVTRSNSLFDGRAWPAAIRLSDGDWGKAWADPGPSPAGNRGPYLKLPIPVDDDAVHRIYPRWQPGDTLLGKETWATTADAGEHPSGAELLYRATDPAWDDERTGLRWRSPATMPPWAVRHRLKVVRVWVERLNDVTERSAKLEGATRREFPATSTYGRTSGWSADWSDVGTMSLYASASCATGKRRPAPLTENDVSMGSARMAIAHAWDHRYGKKLGLWWVVNPWCWLAEVRRC